MVGGTLPAAGGGGAAWGGSRFAVSESVPSVDPVRSNLLVAVTVVVGIICGACASPPTAETPGVTPPMTTPPTAVPPTSSFPPASPPTTSPPAPCPLPPYELSTLPPTVVVAGEDATEAPPDDFTSIGGTNTSLWVNTNGEPAIALIRGTLPPNQFPAERGEVDVAGTRGVAGPYPDGRWVVAWFNEPADRCDQYTMVFYPPVGAADVEATIGGMERVPG